MRQMFAAIFAIMLLTPTSNAAQSIVGTWASSKAACKSDPVLIRPLGIESGYVICHFDSVKRSGNKVTWSGACHVDSDRRPEEGAGTVEAVEKDGRLTIDGLGFGMNDLRRCR